MFLIPSPLQELHSDIFIKHKVKIFVKRDDLIHSDISGNKWRKLSHFIQLAKNENKTTLVSFGGAWSNHIYSLAAAGHTFGFKTVGIIRGEKPKHLSSTLQFALDNGMELYFVSREEYRNKTMLAKSFEEKLPHAMVIPEGGAGENGTVGCQEIVYEIQSVVPDYYALACGTATTLMGIAQAAPKAQVLGFSALKNGEFLLSDWQEFIQQNQIQNAKIISEFSGGGYAKTNAELEDFIVQFYQEHQIVLEPIYTGKMMKGLIELIKRDYFLPDSTIVAIHTGGLQGLEGFPSLKDRLKI